ncbi:MAG: hypothetical protein ACRECH_13360 [Nitrososphaerales archaeon]
MMPNSVKRQERFKLSIGGLILGIIFGIIYILILIVIPLLVLRFLSSLSGSGISLSLSSRLFSLFSSYLYIGVAVALVAVKIVHGAIKEPLTIRGVLKVALGVLTGLFYYLILEGGIITMSVAFSSLSFVVSVTLLVTLFLLEASAVARMLQGIFEFQEGRNALKMPVNNSIPQGDRIASV